MASRFSRVMVAQHAGRRTPVLSADIGMQASHFRTRVVPPFHFDSPQAVEPLVGAAMRAGSISLADDILQGLFRFRGVQVRFDTVQWDHCPGGNSDWTRDLNRQFYLVNLGMAYHYTGREAYALGFVDLVRDWIDENGPESPAWSCPFEVAARLNAWIWSLYLFRGASCLSDEDLAVFTDGLRRQARYLASNLEYHIPTNHLLLEAKTLTLCGMLFPEWDEAASWFKKGMSVLSAETARQVCPDGVHGERSILYHKIITSEISELIWLLRLGGHRIPGALLTSYKRMLEFELNITRSDGSFPLFSDSAASDGYLRFSALAIGAVVFGRQDFARGNPSLTESTIWLLGEKAIEEYRSMAEGSASLSSMGFPDGGYFIMRGGRQGKEGFLAIDCGPFGLPLVPDHGHADALSFDLTFGSRPLVIDSGVYSYNLGQEWRAYFRGTKAHNTLIVDGQDQSIMDGVRHVYRSARTQVHDWLPGRHFDWFDGSHDGYCRSSISIEHRRQVLSVKGDYWIIADWALGQGNHSYDVLFHLPPGSSPEIEKGAIRTRDGNPLGLAILPLYATESDCCIIEGEKDPIQGWVSFDSGTAIPSPTVDYRMSGPAPARFASVLLPFSENDKLPVVSGQIWPVPDGRMVTAGSLNFGGWTDYVMFNLDYPAEPRPGPFYSDGKVGFLRWEEGKGRLARAYLVCGSRLAYKSVPIVKASSRLEWLELALDGDLLDVRVDCREECVLAILVPVPVKLTINGLDSMFTRDGPFLNMSLSPCLRGSEVVER